MRKVIIESPYAGDIERNIAYAKAAVRDCLLRGEAPIASHLLFTQPGILNDDIPEERALGIQAGIVWSGVAEAAVFYLDHGWSTGMQAALAYHKQLGQVIEFRYLYSGESHDNTQRSHRRKANDRS